MIDFYRFEKLGQCDKLLHAITTKSLQSPFSFSMALHTGEEEKDISHNREDISNLLSVNKELHFIVAKQTHSSNIVIVKDRKSKGWKSLEDAIENCDALISDRKDVVLTILTADCVPILLYDEKQEVVAAVHAGWKGTQSEIAFKTIQKMKKEFLSNPKDILAGLAPSIGSCCYEVGEDVARYFFDIPKSFDKIGEKYMLDLPYLNKKQLLNAGVLEQNIEMSELCTACNVDRFFSYRKEQGCSGRFMSMIGLA